MDQLRNEWVTLVRADSRVEWTRKVEGRTRPSSYYDRAIVGHHYVLRTYVPEKGSESTRQRVQVQTFDLDTGAGWTSALGSTSYEFDNPTHLAYVVDGVLHQFFSDDDGQTWLVGYDVDTGVVARRTEVPFSPTDYFVHTHDVVLRQGTEIARVSTDGVITPFASGNGGCSARNSYWSLQQEATGGLSLVSELGGVSIKQRVAGIYLQECATFEDKFVLAVSVRDSVNDRRRDEIWMVGPDGAVTRFPIRLRGQQLNGAVLPRFFIISAWTEADTEELVAIDLKERTLAWRSKFRSVENPVLAGSHWYVAYGSSMLLSIDGATGQLLAAKRVPANWKQSSLLMARNVGEDGIWLRSNDWYRSSTPPVTKLDSALEHSGGTRIETVDVRKHQLFNAIPAARNPGQK